MVGFPRDKEVGLTGFVFVYEKGASICGTRGFARRCGTQGICVGLGVCF